MNVTENFLAQAMKSMPMMPMGPMVYGYSLGAVLMVASGVFYLVCALFIWKTVRREKNELVNALFAFLAYQAVGMFFMGLNMHTMNATQGYIASLAIFIGSAYMLKFPFASFSQSVRKVMFYLSLAAVIGLFAWFMSTPMRQMALMNFTLWYDIIVNGLVVGGSIIIFGLAARDRVARMKSLGGGTGVVSCCVVANSAMLGGLIITSSVFQFLAPVVILGTLAMHRRQ